MSARPHFENQDRADSFDTLRRIDQLYPSHPYGQEAGDLLFEIAEAYRTDTGRRFFIFKYSARAPAIYEYLSAEYPTHEKTDDALFTLAGIYEGERLFDVAIEKHLELIVWAQSRPTASKAKRTSRGCAWRTWTALSTAVTR